MSRLLERCWTLYRDYVLEWSAQASGVKLGAPPGVGGSCSGPPEAQWARLEDGLRLALQHAVHFTPSPLQPATACMLHEPVLRSLAQQHLWVGGEGGVRGRGAQATATWPVGRQGSYEGVWGGRGGLWVHGGGLGSYNSVWGRVVVGKEGGVCAGASPGPDGGKEGRGGWSKGEEAEGACVQG